MRCWVVTLTSVPLFYIETLTNIISSFIYFTKEIEKMRISLRQIQETSQKVAVIHERLQVYLERMCNWNPDFTHFALQKLDKNETRTMARKHADAQTVLRASRKLIREALKVIIPNADPEEADKLALEVLTYENIVNKFEQVYVETKKN